MRAEGGGVGLKVGWSLPYDDVVRAFSFEREEVSHEEDRFDPKSGRKTGTEKVVDVVGGTCVRLNGKEWFLEEWWDASMEEFFEELGQTVGCAVSAFGGQEYGQVAFDLAGDPELYAKDSSYDPHPDWSVGPAVYLGKLQEAMDSFKAQEVRDKLAGLGLEAGPVVVFMAMSVQE